MPKLQAIEPIEPCCRAKPKESTSVLSEPGKPGNGKAVALVEDSIGALFGANRGGSQEKENE
jgi:hypothetical protein